MNIVTLYTKSPATMLAVLDVIVQAGSVTVLGADSAILFTDSPDHDDFMASITIETNESRDAVDLAANLVNDDPVYVREEDPADWK